MRCDLSRIELIYICIELAVEIVGAGIEVTAESGSPVLIPSLRITVEAAYQCTVRIGYELIDKLFVLPIKSSETNVVGLMSSISVQEVMLIAASSMNKGLNISFMILSV